MMVVGRSDNGPTGSRSPRQRAGLVTGITVARSAASALLLRIGWMMVRAGWRVGPPGDPVEEARRMTGDVDPEARRTAIVCLKGEVDDIVDDVTHRQIGDRSADALLVMVEILAWLEDGAEPPGWAATELLEVQVAIFNDASSETEWEIRRALRDVLLCLLGEQVASLRDDRLRRRRIGIEWATESDALSFGESLEELRASRDLTIGELAAAAGLDVVRVVGLLRGVRTVSSAEVLVLADALQVDLDTLLPERPRAAGKGGPR